VRFIKEQGFEYAKFEISLPHGLLEAHNTRQPLIATPRFDLPVQGQSCKTVLQIQRNFALPQPAHHKQGKFHHPN